MKAKYSIILLFLILGVLYLNHKKILPPNEASLYFYDTDNHFDTLVYSEYAGVYFKFKNIGKKPLSITNVEPLCGCTVASFPTNSIYPNQEDSILVEYNTAIRGYFNKGIIIHSNSSTSPDRLKITGFVPFENSDH